MLSSITPEKHAQVELMYTELYWIEKLSVLLRLPHDQRDESADDHRMYDMEAVLQPRQTQQLARPRKPET